MRRSFSHNCRQGQSQFQLQAINFFNKATSPNQQPLDQLTELFRQCVLRGRHAPGPKEKVVNLVVLVFQVAFPRLWHFHK
jgi:hypothetical protein